MKTKVGGFEMQHEEETAVISGRNLVEEILSSFREILEEEPANVSKYAKEILGLDIEDFAKDGKVFITTLKASKISKFPNSLLDKMALIPSKSGKVDPKQLNWLSENSDMLERAARSRERY